jgi:thymidine phosphorylase
VNRAVGLPAETIRRKRDGAELAPEEIAAFVRGLVDGDVSGEQAAAFAMATWFRGMTPAEIVALTFAMRDSGEVLSWGPGTVDGPVLDKHSTGGVGDLVSLPLGPMLAACGAYVPMISGRGLGHTGGTLDKLEAIPGYGVEPSRERFLAVLRHAGVAIVGADARIAPADRRLYAIRDVSATVDSIPLITASILSKKFAAGLGALVLDVKTGNGAVLPEYARSRALAASLVRVATLAGLPCHALLTDMSQPLAHSAGNALEVLEAVRMLRGESVSVRLAEVTLALGAEALVLGGLAGDAEAARARLEAVIASGAAAERFARMVAGLGGPADVVERADALMPRAPVVCDVPAEVAGTVDAIDTRALGLAVVMLGGGRRHPAQPVDPAVGLDRLQPLGARLALGEPLARVHAANREAAAAAVAAVQAAYRLGHSPPAATPTVIARMDAVEAARNELA